jgi:hypothetical protein
MGTTAKLEVSAGETGKIGDMESEDMSDSEMRLQNRA